MLDLLTGPLEYGFMQRALLGTIAVGVAAPICGCWAVSRRLVYLTDAMSHAILAGVAAASLLGGSLLLGGFSAAIVMALLVSVLVVRVTVPEDSAIGVVGQGLFALGVVGVSIGSDPRALAHVLFGNPLTVTAHDVVVQCAMAITVVVAGWFLAPVLAATTFDALHARTVGIRVGLVDTALIVGLALVVVIGLTTVGVLMAITLAVAPAVAARLLTRRLSTMLPVAAVLGIVAGVAGLYVSYYTSLPTGPLVGLTAVAEVAVVAAVVTARRTRSRRVVIGDRTGQFEPAVADA